MGIVEWIFVENMVFEVTWILLCIAAFVTWSTLVMPSFHLLSLKGGRHQLQSLGSGPKGSGNVTNDYP